MDCFARTPKVLLICIFMLAEMFSFLTLRFSVSFEILYSAKSIVTSLPFKMALYRYQILNIHDVYIYIYVCIIHTCSITEIRGPSGYVNDFCILYLLY